MATGGTAKAAIELVEQLGGHVVGAGFVIELEFLKGRERLAGYRVVCHDIPELAGIEGLLGWSFLRHFRTVRGPRACHSPRGDLQMPTG